MSISDNNVIVFFFFFAEKHLIHPKNLFLKEKNLNKAFQYSPKTNGNKFFTESYGKENVHDCKLDGLGNLKQKSCKFLMPNYPKKRFF